jgi:hypothetical protein
MKQAAWAAICELGEELHKREPNLSVHQARDKAMQTAEGRKLLDVYYDRDARLTPGEFKAAKARQVKLGGSYSEVIADVAKARSEARGVSFEDALTTVREDYPTLWAAYETRA